jgi:hypothetical protein
MDDLITAALHAAGLDAYTPAVITLVHAIVTVIVAASALNAALPQPAPGSHWIPIRAVVNKLALAFGAARPASAPAAVTWFQRIAAALIQYLPPPAAPVAQAPRVEPSLGPGSIVIPTPAGPPGPPTAPAPPVGQPPAPPPEPPTAPVSAKPSDVSFTQPPAVIPIRVRPTVDAFSFLKSNEPGD